MLLTVSGPPGSGKSTAATGLSAALGYEHVSGGDVFRELAAERGLSLEEFNALAEEDDTIDRDLDRRLRELAETREDLVLESRLAGWMAAEHADLRIWLNAPIEVRAERIADREDKSVERAEEETVTRSESEARRYEEYYGIDIGDLSIYDLAVNTARWGPEPTTDMLVAAAETYEPAGDEGAFPVTDVRYEF
ncbi:(d)CMP kinase [Halalkalicoccus tibetensis]|uniref:Cytidylate kinase n=1 Tax=Halalkalicoccus tibetensis TaxID=175632 RepID=A0ABD5UY96_9EURY